MSVDLEIGNIINVSFLIQFPMLNVFKFAIINTVLAHALNRDSTVSIATCYILDGSGIESWHGRIFCTHPCLPWGLSSLLYNGYWVIPGVKWLGCDINHSSQYSAEVKERVDLYLYSPSGPSWRVLGCTLPLLFTCTDFIAKP